ncbi:MAG: tetratricopeptide repeat protein, partial [Leptolyngbya sp.]|nr:tetratricopeptide repeat protein [Candidatus Melainabacteria bacterium]
GDDETRLQRIEKRVYGDPSQGPIGDRLEKAKASLGPQREPDGTMSGAGGQSPQQAPPAASPQSAPPQSYDDPDAAIERAKLSVAAAKEEELQRLLADGVGLWRNRRAQEATEKFEQVVRLDPRNAEAHFSMGIIQEASGNYAEALSSYQKAYESKPHNKDYRAAIVEVEKKANKREKIDGSSGELRVLSEDAAAAFKRGEYMSALDMYKQFEAKAPPQANIKYNIGTLYLMMKNYSSALDYYKQARKLKPSEPKYVQAVQQLESNLKRDNSERNSSQKESQQAWDAQEKQRAAMNNRNSNNNKNNNSSNNNSNNNNKNNFAPLGTPSASKGQEIMNGFGLIGKSSRDGIVIVAVGIASRATRAGILQGDIIKAVDGSVVKSTSDLNNALQAKITQQRVNLTVQRGDRIGQVPL